MRVSSRSTAFRARWFFACIAVLPLLGLVSSTVTAQTPTMLSYTRMGSASSAYVPGQVVVRLRDSNAATDRSRAAFAVPFVQELSAVLAPLRTTTVDTIPARRTALVQLPANLTVGQAVYRLSRDPRVQYAEPNYYVYPTDTLPNDPLFQYCYGLNNTGQSFYIPNPNFRGKAGADIKALKAWDLFSGSKNVVVGVIDTGADYTHPDLAGNIWTNPGETGVDAAGKDKATNGIDDDGDGIIDDVHGVRFYNAGSKIGDPTDDNAHGTHVAGTIGAIGNNSLGISGVNWNVTIVPVKFINANDTGTDFDAAKSVDYLTNLKRLWQTSNGLLGADVSIVNNSWGGSNRTQLLYDAFKAAADAGIIHVCAAGNNATNNDIIEFYPADFIKDTTSGPLWNIVTVAATNYNDGRTGFSNFGRKTVQVAAPGDLVYSTVPLWWAKAFKLNDPYSYFSGTSMASPHVAGALALLKGYMDSKGTPLTPQQMIQRLLKTGDPLPSLWRRTVSSRRLNAFSLLTDTAVADLKPTTTFDVALTTNKKTYAAGERVNIYVKTTRTGKALAGVEINLSLKRPDGTTINVSKKTDSLGQANFVYVLPRTSASGVYTLAVDAFFRPLDQPVPDEPTVAITVP